MNRREMLVALGGGVVASRSVSVCAWHDAAPERRTSLGLVTYCLGNQQLAGGAAGEAGNVRNLADPLTMLEFCHKLGVGGIQVSIKPKETDFTNRLRQRAEAYRMYVEGIAGLPRDKNDTERFEADVLAAKDAGVKVIRVTMMPGRRYERFQSLAEFREFVQRGARSLELAEPVAARHRIRLALENHKDQRIPERLDLLKRLSSEYVGVCVDTGNSFALLEDPIAVIEAYAPWAATVHLKDQAVQEYADGFLFADVPLGQGFLDLKRMVAILRQASPEIHFGLELITRDPLKVPCLTEEYWPTLADVPGSDLARTLRVVRASAAKQLPQVSSLSVSERAALERDNIEKSITYAHEQLGL